MGASGWDYVVPFEPKLGVALEKLRKQEFEDHAYYFRPGDDGWPTTMEQLWADEIVKYEGTHSILDVFRTIAPDDADAFGTLRPLREEEQLHYFGTTTPSRATFEAAYNAGKLTGQGIRWSGYSAVLYADGRPTEIAIWGVSGD